MPTQHSEGEQKLLMTLIDGLSQFDDDDKLRLIRTVMTYYNLESPMTEIARATSQPTSGSQESLRKLSFSDHEDLSAKEFLHDKQPRTDIERVACLAFYLAHYRDTPHFKTIDISKLNTEAAQLKFSNAANAVANATKKGLIAPAGKGAKQISAIGEQFVDALPDRDAAKAIGDKLASKRRAKRKKATSKK
ncbi:MAG: hypothetical protein ABL309_01745 [Phycisphaerales bacterium]